MKTIVCDLDGVLCEEGPTFSRSFAPPIEKNIGYLRELYFRGFKVVIFTARSWSEYELTKRWLNEYQVPYDQLICGKIIGDFWIDDRMTDLETLTRNVELGLYKR